MPATIAFLSKLAATDPQGKACGPKGGQGWLCATVYRLSHSTGAAEVADALARPIRIVFVIALALISVRLARRAVMRLARHVRDDRIPASHPERAISGHDSTALDILRRAQRINTIASVLCNVISVVVWTVAGMAILSDLGVDLSPFIAGAGVLTVVVGFGVSVPPGGERGVARRHHYLRGGHARFESCGEGGRGECDVLAQCADVAAAEALTENVDGPARGMLVKGRDPEQRCLARAVGAEDDPALTAANLPADVVENAGAVEVERDVRAEQRGAHEAVSVSSPPSSARRRDYPRRSDPAEVCLGWAAAAARPS